MPTSLPASYLGELLDGRYRLKRVIGEGASSWVFAADDLRLERQIALKLFKSPDAEDEGKQRRRLASEGRTLAKLVHPHIVAVHDVSEGNAGHAYLVMELCEAGTLESELAVHGYLELDDTLRLLLPLLGALAYAHDRDVVHRDIKPSNIVLIEDGSVRRCKLLDFGISLSTGVGLSSDLALGTPSYMAPEQARGLPPTAATDVWALGVVFFRCLSGTLPFEASNAPGIILKLVQERAPRFGTVCNEIGPCLAAALDRALEPDLGRRYSDVRSFARALAVACVQDKIPLPTRPEPIGLPDFERWLASGANAQTTREIDVKLPGAYGASAGKRSLRARLAKPALAAALVALAAGGAWSLLDAESARGKEQAATSARALERDALAVNQSHAPRTDVKESAVEASDLTRAAELGSAAELPESAPKATTEATLRSAANRKKRSSAGKESPVRPRDDAPRLIENWDW